MTHVGGGGSWQYRHVEAQAKQRLVTSMSRLPCQKKSTVVCVKVGKFVERAV